MSRNFRCALRPSSQYPHSKLAPAVAPSLPPPPTAEPADGSRSVAGGLGPGRRGPAGSRPRAGRSLGGSRRRRNRVGAARPLRSFPPAASPQPCLSSALRLDLRPLYPTPPPRRVYANPLHTEPHTSRRKLLLATSAEFFPPETPFSAFREPPHPQLAACLPSVETRSLSGEHGGRAGGERGSRLGRPRRPVDPG